MDFFQKIGETVSQKGVEVGQKAKKTAGTMSLSLELRDKESSLEKLYFDLGVEYCQKHKNDEEPEFQIIRDIIEAEKECRDLRDQIAARKGKDVCPGCGEYVENGHKYCPNCGMNLEMYEED